MTENRLACFTLILASALTIADVAEANKNELPIGLKRAVMARPGIESGSAREIGACLLLSQWREVCAIIPVNVGTRKRFLVHRACRHAERGRTKLHDAINAALTHAKTRAVLENLGSTVRPGTIEESSRFSPRSGAAGTR